MVNAVMVKKHLPDLMALCQGGVNKRAGTTPGIGLVRAGIDLQNKFHNFYDTAASLN
jgi:hypothetical protein